MKSRIWAVLLIFVLVFLISVPAVAEEGGDGGGYADVQPSGDDAPPDEPSGPVEPDPGGEDPTPEPGWEDPTPEPGGEDPTPEPGGEDPTPEPGGEDPTPDPGWEDPTPEPGDEPPVIGPSGDDPDSDWTPPPDTSSDDNNYVDNNTGGSASSSAPSTPSATRAPNSGTGGTTIRQPATLNRDATPSPGPSGSPDPDSSGPRYMTFARVNQKNNSMSVVLFYGGASFIGVGSVGLVVLVVFIVRGRRRVDERDGIFEEIQQAESRRPASQPRMQAPAPQRNPQSYDQGYQERTPAVHRPDPEELSMPINGNMYTEEFDPPPVPREAQAPPQAVMYTEEFPIPDLPPAPRQAPPARPQPVQRPRPVQPPPPPPQSEAQYDTTELLREILYNEGEDRRG